MPLNKVVFSSVRLDWRTPNWLYRLLDREFHFTFDPCPNRAKFNGLATSWGKRNFINPPYGRKRKTGILKWIEKGYEEEQKGNLCVFLLPSRTDQPWFHFCLRNASEIRFILGRLRFEGAKWDAPFSSIIVVFKPHGRY